MITFSNCELFFFWTFIKYFAKYIFFFLAFFSLMENTAGK